MERGAEVAAAPAAAAAHAALAVLLFSTPSVVTPARPGISWRPIFAIARFSSTSPQFSFSGRWKMPSGRCGMFSFVPQMPSSVSTLS